MFSQRNDERDVLEKIREEFKSNHPIKPKGTKYSSLSISSAPMCRKLVDMGLNNNKSHGFDFDKLLTYVPEEFSRDFIRGMFDGDGSIRIYKYDYFSKHTYHLGFTGIQPLCDYVYERFGLNTKIANEGNGIYTVVSACRADIVRIGHFMYDDATIYMNRKKETFERVYALNETER